MLKLDLEYKKGIFFMRLKGNLNYKKVFKINNYVVPVIKKHQIKKIIINFCDLKNIDESGVDSILNVKCAVKNNKGVIFFCEVKENILSRLKRLRIKTLSTEMSCIRLIEV